MFTLKVENKTGSVLTLTQNEGNYQIVNIDGLNPPNAVINSSEVAGMDGSIFNSSKLQERNIVLDLKINGEVEVNRLFLYRYFRTKQWCRLYYTNGSRDVYIEGYVETIECNLFELGQTMQISIVCQDPYFKALDEITTDISKEISAFVFPFSFGGEGAIVHPDEDTDEAIPFSTIEINRVTNIINDGEAESGLIIDLVATGTVVNPVIYDANDGARFIKLTQTMNIGDEIIIDTRKGHKSATLVSGGIKSNIIRKITPINGIFPTWFQLAVGDNEFTYSADSGSEFLGIVFRHSLLFEGV